ncbi:MAG: flagellar protein FlaG [Helicobacteraceae bacterium]|jgi:flagellar protein FlaG|nr:flagellar protein FlaG [Helicobacteraceae bacterium]
MEIGGISSVLPSATGGAAQEARANEQSRQASSVQEIADRAVEDGVEAQINRERFVDLIANLNDSAQALRMQLRFGYSEDIKGLYLSVLDAKSGDIIRQIPSEQAIKFIARMREVAGLLLEERV